MDRENQIANLRMTVYASLLAALTAAGSYLYIPVGPVPIYLANLFIFLAGLLLGSKWGLASVGIYLLAGVCGLPVFAGGTGGIGRFAGPTGGYLIGFLPAVFVIGMISKSGRLQTRDDIKGSTSLGKQPVIDVLAMICGTVVIYAVGIVQLKIVTGMPLGKSLAVGMYPFLLGDALKIAAAVPIAKALRPLIMDK